MKSVCILNQNFYDTDARVRRKADALVAAGYTVDVLALRFSPDKKRYTLNGVNVYTLPLGKKRASLVRYFIEYFAFFVWAFVRVPLMMRRRRYEVIDVNTLPDFLVFAPIIARWMGARILLDMHEITPEFYMSKYGIPESSGVVRVLKWVEKISFNFADHVTTINEPIQNLLADRGLRHSKSTVIMNVADEARFISRAGASAAADAAAAPGRVVMMYHGTITRMYGLDIAIEAFALARNEMPHAELWIIGFGPQEEELKNLIRERGLGLQIKFVGTVPPAEMPSWLNKGDIGILPMRRDVLLNYAFPNKLGEFLIMGKCIIVSRLATLRHYFSGEAVAYVEPGDPADLARQMVRVYRDPELRARLVAKARTEYAPICWDVMKQRYLQLIERLAGHESSALSVPNVRTAADESQASKKAVLAG